jgi:hypothetical protein
MPRDDKTSRGAGGNRTTSTGALVALVLGGLGLHLYWLLSRPLEKTLAEASGAIEALSGPHLSAFLLVFAPLVLVFSGLTLFLVRHALPTVWSSVRRATLLGVLLGACVFGAALLASGRLRGLTELNWLFFVPTIPPVLLGYQALIVWRQRPRSLGRFSPGVPVEMLEALERDGSLDRFKRLHAQLLRVFGGRNDQTRSSNPGGSVAYEKRTDTGAAYQPAYFVTNFAVPGLLLLLVGFGALSLAWRFPDWPLDYWVPDGAQQDVMATAGRLEVQGYIQRGLRWGVAGAFTYVLIEFGGRFFRNDLTVGAATWSIITLLVGPTLAVVMSVAWKMEAGSSPWQTGAVLFFAGLAPRRIVTIVENVALQFLKTPSEAATPPKVMPLTSLRGVTAEVALRLREENVQDVNGLAYADAIRLVQALPYDLRQIVDWIDQAQLALVLPKHYETLRDNGVSGAIDLAWRWLRCAVKTTEQGSVLAPPESPPESFKLLVNQVDQDARLVYETGAQLFYEEQVCLLWVMYNCFSTTAGAVDLSFADEAPVTTPAAPPSLGSTPVRSQVSIQAPASSPVISQVRDPEPTPPPQSRAQAKPGEAPSIATAETK